jgi:hypothetical protein
MAKTLKSSLPTGSVGARTKPSKMSLTLCLVRSPDDIEGVGQRAGEAVDLDGHEGIEGPAYGEGLLESSEFAVLAGDSVVDVDQVFRDGECLRPACWELRSWELVDT